MSDSSFNPSDAAVEAAPEAENTAVSADANPDTPTAEGDPPEPRTFTQDELTKIINKENAKTERRLKREWEAAQTVDAQRVSLGEPPDPKQFKSEDE